MLDLYEALPLSGDEAEAVPRVPGSEHATTGRGGATLAGLVPVPRVKRPDERFWAKVQMSDGCWLWTGSKNSRGYGRFYFKGTICWAHRIAYILANDAIPDSMCVCHRCDNPSCVRPDHLFLGTLSENTQDQLRKGRHPNASKTSCRNGHPYDATNTYRTPDGSRGCRVCNRAAKRRYLDRRRAA